MDWQSGLAKMNTLKRCRIPEEELTKPIQGTVAYKPNSGFETEDVREFCRIWP